MKKGLLLLIGWLCAIGILHSASIETSPQQMTALVGPGCVIDQIDKSLIEAVASTTDLGNIVDNNLKNYASFGSALSTEVAYSPTLAVKDIKHTYAAGVTAGFVIQAADGEGTNLLSANILQMFWVETYLDGIKQETSKDNQSSGGTLLSLNLLTIAADGKTQVAVKTTKPFNEVRLSVSGVNADVLSHLKIYYAFVGENPITPITKTNNNFPDASVHASNVTGIGNEWTTAVWNWPTPKDNLVGAGSEDKGVGFGTLSSLLTEPRVTINAGKVIPAGTEVGFLIESGTVLAIDLLNNTVLTTYDANDNQIDSKTIVSVLGISALGGGKSLVSMITTAPCSQIKIKFGGINIDVGGTKIFYAYTRETNVAVPESCGLKISADIVVCSDYQTQINGPAGTQWSVVSQPDGAVAAINSSGLIYDMTKDGTYVVAATLGNCSDTIRITRHPDDGTSYDCNRPLVGTDVSTFAPEGGGCLLCIATGTTGTVANITDGDLTNYIEYTQGLDLASNTSIIGIHNATTIFASEAEPRRVGFVMQATNQFLNVNLLKFFVIKTYLDGVEQESSLVEQNNAIGADLIAGVDNQVRYSFTAKKDFNEVALWTAGLLDINISKFRIYYAFEEPADNDCLVGGGNGACISMLSSDEYGAEIAYNHTGFSGLANVGAFMTNLSHVLDGDMNTYALINKVAGVGSAATLSVKTNKIIGNGYQTGFIIQDQTWVTNADLLSQVKIKTYLNGVQTGDEFGTPAVLSLDLIGSGDRAYLTVIPTEAFDEIQLDLSGLLDAAVNTKVFGAFIRKDTDGDGTPDCVDKNPCGPDFVITQIVAGCAPYPVTMSYEGGKDNAQYSVWDGMHEYNFVDNTVEIPTLHGGKLVYIIRENGIDIMTKTVLVNPEITKWTGAVSTRWDDPENWTEGVPASCTNVIIPEVDSLITTNGIHYPILEKPEVCKGIHFGPGAEVVRTDLLNYTQAWIEMKLSPDKNYMVTIPLNGTYIGDLFVGGNTYYDNRKLFTPLTGHVQRFSPSATTRKWNVRAWTANTAAYNVALPSGFSIKLDKGKYPAATKFVFRFAKEDTIYYHYNPDGSISSEKPDTLIRPENQGRFIYENTAGKYPQDGYTMTVGTVGTLFVVGNPFMCHLKISEFYAANENVSQVKVYDPENPADPNLTPANATLIDPNDTLSCIAPMQSFFITLKANPVSYHVTFTKEMMTKGNYAATAEVSASQMRTSHPNGSQIRPASLKVYSKDGKGVIESADPIRKLQVFSITGQLILEKQNVSSPVYLPLTDGINMIQVQTEKETKTFKLIK